MNPSSPAGQLPDALASDSRFRGLFETMAEGVIYQDAQGRVLDANPAAQHMLGLTLEQLMDRSGTGPAWTTIHDDGSPFPEEDHPARVALRTGQPVRDVVMGIRPPGAAATIWAMVSAIPEFSPGEARPWRACATFTDITELKTTRDELEMTGRRLRTVLANSQAVIFQLDPEGRFVLSEGLGLKGLGLKPGEVVGLSALDLFAENPAVIEQVKLALAGAHVRVSADIRGMSFDTLYTPVFDAQGRLESVIGIATDITEQRRSERALHASEATYRGLFDSVGEAIYVQSREGRFLDVNRGATEMYGYTREELIGQTPAMVSAPDLNDIPAVMDCVAKAFQGEPQAFEFWGLRKNGEVFPKEVHLYPGTYLGEKVVFAVSRDMTEQRRAAAALSESEARFRGLYEHTTDVMFWLRLEPTGEFVVEDINPRQEEVLGLPKAAIVGRKVQDLLPEDVAGRVLANYRRCIEKRAPISYEEIEDLDTGRVVLQTLLIPIMDAAGKVFRIVGVSRDMTQQRIMEESLRHSQKLESLGVLAGGIAHDFNNLLTAIMGNLNLAQTKAGEHSPLRPHLDNIEKTAVKAAQLSRQMLAYSGKGHFVIKAHDLNAIVREMTGLMEVSLPKKVVLDLNLAPAVLPFQADAAQIQQVVLNLVTNAADAIGNEEGRITVATYVADLDREVLSAGFPGQVLEAGEYLVLSVEDTGCGMTPDVRSRIFDPFFTTKAAGRGLGLSAMLGILKGHKAGLRIETEPGKGTTFEVYFPAHTEDFRKEDEAPGRDGTRMMGTVLLVDDEDMILEAITPALASLGFKVVTAGDGVQALERVEELGAELDLVIMDLSMPRMDGAAAFGLMRKVRPDLPVVLTSGYDEKDVAEDLFPRGLAGFIQKPYRIQDLARVLDAVLYRRSSSMD